MEPQNEEVDGSGTHVEPAVDSVEALTSPVETLAQNLDQATDATWQDQVEKVALATESDPPVVDGEVYDENAQAPEVPVSLEEAAAAAEVQAGPEAPPLNAPTE